MHLDDVGALVRGSRVFDLGIELFPGMPHVPTHAPYGFSLIREHGDMMLPDGACVAVESIFCTGHTGTHVDALSHFSQDMKLHGGVDAAKAQSKTGGFTAHGIETVAPIVRRGVFIDVAAHQKCEVLQAGHPIEQKELQAAAEAQGVRIEAGDVVLIRTGHMQYWPGPNYYRHAGGIPGINLGTARWLSDQGVYMTGSDTFCVEVRPAEGSPVHVHMLVEKGIHLLEVANLEELSRGKIHEFLFVCLPLKIRGGTGSPVRPVAIL
ncbi:MAG: cyclase family protein [bacterium]|nr:cyclase family protein [bacterium]